MPARISDETITAGLALSDATPGYVEWYGQGRVTIRIETHIGHYAEGWLYPFMSAEDVAGVLRSLSRRLDEQ